MSTIATTLHTPNGLGIVDELDAKPSLIAKLTTEYSIPDRLAKQGGRGVLAFFVTQRSGGLFELSRLMRDHKEPGPDSPRTW